MKITMDWLKKENACEGGVDYYNTLNETDALIIMERLIADKKLDFANWTIVHLLNHENRVQYTIFAARQVLVNYTKIYPDDKRVENAIVAAENWLKNPNSEAASAAARAAYSAYSAAYSAYSAARAADRAAYSAARAADRAAYSAASAADSAASAARAAYSAARAADSAYSVAYSAASAARAADSAAYSAASAADRAAYELKLKIIRNGIELFKKQEAI